MIFTNRLKRREKSRCLNYSSVDADPFYTDPDSAFQFDTDPNLWTWI
jgi:hypothetical protein